MTIDYQLPLPRTEHPEARPRQSRVRVAVRATDPVSHAGIVGALRARPELELVTTRLAEPAAVEVVVGDEFDGSVLTLLKRTAHDSGTPIVLVASGMQRGDIVMAVEHGVVAVIPRNAVTDARLARAVVEAAGGNALLPPDLLGGLLGHVRDLRKDVLRQFGVDSAGLSSRETDVLRLVAEGASTAEIAEQLAYSERTVKNILYAVTNRLNLRNRSHAVAYAIRTGII